jgi:1-acyl-sn-glycerol-3-phosphate acyltransferase
MTSEDRRVCQATTKAGRPCNVLALPGYDYCAIHQPAEAMPGADEAERERLEAHSPSIRARLRQVAAGQDLLNPEVLKGSAYMARYVAQLQADLLKRRYTGEYETDAWGLDWEVIDELRPLFAVLLKAYWQIQVVGIEHVPAEGPALLVANHCAPQPWDGLIVQLAVLNQHPAGRLARPLYEGSIPGIPILSSLLTKLGHALAAPDNAVRLLEQGELVVIFPEGTVGLGRGYRAGSRLAPFGAADLLAASLRAGVPVVPVALRAGAVVRGWRGLRRARPDVPGAAAAPARHLLRCLPPPARWEIAFGEPIPTVDLGSGAASPVLASQLADLVRYRLQQLQ